MSSNSCSSWIKERCPIKQLNNKSLCIALGCIYFALDLRLNSCVHCIVIYVLCIVLHCIVIFGPYYSIFSIRLTAQYSDIYLTAFYWDPLYRLMKCNMLRCQYMHCNTYNVSQYSITVFQCTTLLSRLQCAAQRCCLTVDGEDVERNIFVKRVVKASLSLPRAAFNKDGFDKDPRRKRG